MDLTVGARVRLLSMPNDPNPIEPGSEGTINYVGKFPGEGQQIGVDWDSGRTLMLIVGEDDFELV
jgi:hypothetical protein